MEISYVDCYTDGIKRLGEVSTLSIEKLEAGETAYIEVGAKINQSTDDLNMAEISGTIKTTDSKIYRTNIISEKVIGPKIKAEMKTETTAKNETGYVKSGDKITYIITLENIGDIDANLLTVRDMFSSILFASSLVGMHLITF